MTAAKAKSRPMLSLAVRCAVAGFMVLIASAAKADNIQKYGSIAKWQLFCKAKIANTTDCALVQAVQGDHSSDRLSLTLTELPSFDLSGRIRIEPQPANTEGISLLIDGIQSQIAVPDTCDVKGCSINWYLTPSLTAKLVSSRKLEAQFRTSTNLGVSLALDLSKLPDALLSLQAKLPSSISSNTAGFVLSRSGDASFTAELVDLTRNDDGAPAVPNQEHPIVCGSTGNTPDLQQSVISLQLVVNSRMTASPTSSQGGALVNATRDCGSKVGVLVRPVKDGTSGTKSEAIMQMQQAAVETYLQLLGVKREQVIIADSEGKALFAEPLDGQLGAWKRPNP